MLRVSTLNRLASLWALHHADFVSFCLHFKDQIKLNHPVFGCSSGQAAFVLDLRKDEHILGELMKRAEVVIPPVVRRYDVVIVEHLKKVVVTEAASWAEAEAKVRREWEEGEHILDADNFAGVSFTLGG